jgi:hypothetical protein
LVNNKIIPLTRDSCFGFFEFFKKECIFRTEENSMSISFRRHEV